MYKRQVVQGLIQENVIGILGNNHGQESPLSLAAAQVLDIFVLHISELEIFQSLINQLPIVLLQTAPGIDVYKRQDLSNNYNAPCGRENDYLHEGYYTLLRRVE